MTNNRNKPCHCGSGRKYKHCHLRRDERAARARRSVAGKVHIDVLAAQLAEVMADETAYAARDEPAATLRSAFCQLIGAGLGGAAAAQAIEAQLNTLEAAMAAVLGGRPAELWWVLSRRLPPAAIGGASVWTVALYRRVLTLAIVKHGASEQMAIEHIETEYGPTHVPVGVTSTDWTEIASLEVLAWEYAMTAAAGRRVGKGATLTQSDGLFNADADDQLQRLLESVDRRADAYGSLASPHGALSTDNAKIDSPDQMPLVVTGLHPNAEGRSGEALSKWIGIDLPPKPAFVPLFLDLTDVRAVANRFPEGFAAAYGSQPDETIATLWSLSWNLIQDMDALPNAGRQALTVGYHVNSQAGREDFEKRMAHTLGLWFGLVANQRLDAEQSRQHVRAGLNSLTYSAEDRESISLWDRLPFKVLVDFGERTYTDFSAITETVSGFFRAVGSVEGTQSNLKGESYEREVLRRGVQAGLSPWLAQRKLVAADATEREIDVSFLVGETLWVCECKAITQDVRFDRGDFAKLKARRERLEKYLGQARTLAEFLQANRSGRNYDVPEGAKQIEHCVVTSGVEWIWDESPDLWLTPTVPRICTIDELLAHLGVRPEKK